MRQLYLLDPYDPFPRPSSLMEVRGGPWELAHVRLQSNGGIILHTLASARVACALSVLEGIDSCSHRAKVVAECLIHQ